MPHPDAMLKADGSQDFFVNMYRRQEIAAEVPAIRLTREEWDSILKVIQCLGDLVDDLCPNEVRTSLIQGSVIAEAANIAWGCKHWLRL
jgi:hypothetical protein